MTRACADFVTIVTNNKARYTAEVVVKLMADLVLGNNQVPLFRKFCPLKIFI